MLLRQRNPKKQGDVGLGAAIGWFTAHGYTVSVPLTDSQDYDLIVDDGNDLLRVQVKTTTFKMKAHYVVALKTCGGNRKEAWNKRFDHSSVELLFVLTEAGDKYLFKTSDFTAGSSMNLGPDKDKFKVY